jgi:hypothetical protein
VPPHGDAGEVEAAHEGRLRRLAGIDHPALLVLAAHRRRPVPADLEARPSARQQRALFGRAAEQARTGRGLGIGPPYQKTHVEAAGDGPVQHVEQRAASVGKEEVVGIEGNGQPDAVVRAVDRLADPPHGLLAVDQRAHEIAGPRRIGTRRRRRNVRGMAGGRGHETIGAGTSSASLSVVIRSLPALHRGAEKFYRRRASRGKQADAALRPEGSVHVTLALSSGAKK